MLANPFDYYIFQPLQYITYISSFGKVLKSTERAEFIYNEWLDSYYHRALLFYHSQYHRLQQLAEREFRRRHGLSEDYSDYNYELQEKWDDFRANIGLDRHYENYKALGDKTNPERDNIRKWMSKYKSTASLEKELSDGRPRLKEINALWFDLNIRNDEATTLDLRELPYEVYLKTKHWAKVRAAQMLIHRAVCQEKSHYSMGESWYAGDWESDIHVHHLTYENRGNERIFPPSWGRRKLKERLNFEA